MGTVVRYSQSLDQRRAVFAYDRIKVRQRDLKNESTRGLYISYVSNIAASILINGLGQALAMERAAAASHGDSGEVHRKLYEDITSWLGSEDSQSGLHGAADILRALLDSEQEKYLHAQVETIQFCGWLKQFARAYLQQEERRKTYPAEGGV